MVTSWPRRWEGDTSAMYTGTVMDAIPKNNRRRERRKRHTNWIHIAFQIYCSNKATEWITYAKANCEPSTQKNLFAVCDTQDDSSSREDEASEQNADSSAEKPVEKPSSQSGKSRSANSDGDQQLLPQRAQVHLSLQQKHGSRHHSCVIAKQESTQSREESQGVHETWGGVLDLICGCGHVIFLVVGLDIRWRFYQTPFVLNSPVSYQLLHSLEITHIDSYDKENTLRSSHDMINKSHCLAQPRMHTLTLHTPQTTVKHKFAN